ncbi:MAG: antifreeze protein, partial [Alphaproteobacteria bacterium]|nr:antifreeze protein [Alphaproteobacteria bacterium]
MTASRAKRAVWALIAAVGVAGAAGVARAEAPISLTPRSSAPLTPTVPFESFEAVPAPRVEPPAPSTGGGGIRVDALKPLDPAAAGLLDLQRGGLGDEMWSGSRLAVVQRLMPGLPATAPSHAMRALMQRLLLSQAAVPEGKSAGPSLIRLRVERLFAMGAVPEMLRLLDALPSTSVPADLLRFKIEGLLLEGDGPGACAESARLGRGGDGFAGKLRVYCRLIADRSSEAALGLDVLREQGHFDPAFFAVAESVIGPPGAPGLDSLPDPSPLQVAMLRLAGQALPADAARSAHPAVLKAVAASTVTPIEVRLAAAEKAEAIGALPTEDLRKLYAATTFTEQQAKGSL